MGTKADIHTIASDMLRRQGQRYTAGRRRLVHALSAAGGPVTLPTLLAVRNPLPQSSAYRNLVVLEQAGVVRRLVHSAGHAHYELAEDLTRHHHHLVCEGCGAIRDVELGQKLERSLHRAITELADLDGFTPRHHAIDIFGHCPDCAA